MLDVRTLDIPHPRFPTPPIQVQERYGRICVPRSLRLTALVERTIHDHLMVASITAIWYREYRQSDHFRHAMRHPALLALLLAVLASACRPQDPGAPTGAPDTLPFKFVSEQEVVLDPAQAASDARRLRASVEAEAAAGLELTIWATEELVEDPIALDVDDSGDLYVTGSSRSGGLLDIRNHPGWRHDALAMKSVHDHEQYLMQVLAPERSAENDWLPDLNEDGSRDWRDLTVRKERLYRLQDTDDDGAADRSRVIVEGFNAPVDDVLGGLLVHEGDVYLSSAPGLYHIENGAEGSILSWGYGVHPGFFGHGMSGVTVGPDGRIYWSVGDMGLSIVSHDGTRHDYPNQGTVLRAFPDGSGFEVFAAGLRNTHEFDFDARGNLISVDNDGDHPGEMERIVYIVDGSDSGWRVNWQFGKYSEDRNNAYKVWMDEELFKPHFDGQAAYITPPIANYHAGPAGMAYNPGTALNDEWTDHFFISEYTGSPATTNVHAFRLEESGAGFDLAAEKVAVSGVLTVGIAFGPDGALYLADWIDGWDSKGAGRIWKLDAADPDAQQRARTRELMMADYEAAAAAELFDRLGYPDVRIRRKAQFELSRRGDAETLLRAAREADQEPARLHGLWGIWQLALRNTDAAEPLVGFLGDGVSGDVGAEMRAQSAKILGDVGYTPASESLVPLLGDPSDRVRFFAAQGLGRLGYGPAFEGIVAMLAENDGEDVYLRHAGALAMARMGNADAIVALADHASEAVRTAAVVALRRMKHEGVAAFLHDDSEDVVTEAARAINDDGGIDGAVPDLAALLGTTPYTSAPLVRRVISANLRTGSAESAERLASYALQSDPLAALRAEAVAVLGIWPAPSVLDRVDGFYLGPVERDTSVARSAAAPIVEPLMASAPEALRIEIAVTTRRLRIEDAAPHLIERLQADASAAVRRAALEALVALKRPDHGEVIRIALADDDAGVRMQALRLVSQADIAEAEVAELLASAVTAESIEEVQSALSALGTLKTTRAHDVLTEQMDRLERGSLAREIELDVLEAADTGGSEALRDRVAAYRASRPPFSAALYGGDFDRGRTIYFNHDGAQCTRCHALQSDGDNVGPDLGSIGSRLSREQLLESLVEPAARIAPGFGTDGGPSAMPDMEPVLTEMEIRDVVAFLVSLR